MKKRPSQSVKGALPNEAERGGIRTPDDPKAIPDLESGARLPYPLQLQDLQGTNGDALPPAPPYDAKKYQISARLSNDASLAEIERAWPTLPVRVRTGILAMARTTSGSNGESPPGQL